MNYVMSDIHGEYERFLKMLKKITFSNNDFLYIIGDIPSRGSQTFELLEYVMSKTNIVHIKGNHELFLQLYLEGDVNMWLNYERFGGANVVRALRKMSAEDKNMYHDYLAELPLYKKIQVNNKEYFLTHSGFMADLPAIKDAEGMVDMETSILKWCEVSEYEYLISNDLHYIPASVKYPFMIVGHYPTEKLECNGIFFGDRYINIDNGLTITKGRKLACLRLEDMKEYYT